MQVTVNGDVIPVKSGRLDLSKKDIDHIDAIDGLDDLAQLRELDLSDNAIYVITGLEALEFQGKVGIEFQGKVGFKDNRKSDIMP